MHTSKIFGIVLITFLVLFSNCKEASSSDSSGTAMNDEQNIEENVNIGTLTSAQVQKLKFAELKFEDYLQFNSMKKIGDYFSEEQVENLNNGNSTNITQTVVTNPATNHQIRYIWNADGTLHFIEAGYKIFNANYEETGIQMIESNCGLHLGMSLSEFSKWNGKPLSFYGFGWGKGGVIIDTSLNDSKNCSVIPRLGIDNTEESSSSLFSDEIFSSSLNSPEMDKIYINMFRLYSEN